MLLLAVGTGISAYAVAKLQDPSVRVVEYARADKFHKPKYGSVKDMEDVSTWLHYIYIIIPESDIFVLVGNRRGQGSVE